MRKRYPVEPLVAFARIPLDDMLRRLSCSGSVWLDAKERGITAERADHWAVKLGIHAANIWPELLDDQIQETSRMCAANDCMETFLPADPERRKRLYCSRRCMSRMGKRRQRADPEGNRKVEASRQKWRDDVSKTERGRRYLLDLQAKRQARYRARIRARDQLQKEFEEAMAS